MYILRLSTGKCFDGRFLKPNFDHESVLVFESMRAAVPEAELAPRLIAQQFI
jgi:hypothetical protein